MNPRQLESTSGSRRRARWLLPLLVIGVAAGLWVWSDARRERIADRLMATFGDLALAACHDRADGPVANVRWSMPIVLAAWTTRVRRLCLEGGLPDDFRVLVDPAPAGDAVQIVRFEAAGHGLFILEVRIASADDVPLVTGVRDLPQDDGNP